jgi:hypothetical protein
MRFFRLALYFSIPIIGQNLLIRQSNIVFHNLRAIILDQKN